MAQIGLRWGAQMGSVGGPWVSRGASREGVKEGTDGAQMAPRRGPEEAPMVVGGGGGWGSRGVHWGSGFRV